MALSRRDFLRYAAGSGLALGLGNRLLLATPHDGARVAQLTGNPLRIPPVFQGDTLTAATTTQRLWPDLDTEMMTLGGSHPAPTIRVRSGDQVTFRLLNQLSMPTNIHFHGLLIPAEMDGHPKDVTAPGGSFTYSFRIRQRAATCWYHPHPHMLTAGQIYMGMAGLFIIEDDEELGLGLPSGEYDVPLIFQDRRLAGERVIRYETSEDDHIYGYLGDSIFVNGTPDPYLAVSASLYRFRALNASNARVLRLGFSDAREFHVIGTDGGLLEKPYAMKEVLLAPGERVEMLVDFSGDSVDTSVTLKTLNNGSGEGANGYEQGTEMPIIRFDVMRAGAHPAIPTTLATLEQLDPATAARSRHFELRIDHGAHDMHTINKKAFHMERIDETVMLGEDEIWEFENISFLHHPMHIHGAQFQVLDRRGSTDLFPNDHGWKDTIRLRPFESARVMVRFPRWNGIYLTHCHNLEHEDHGMMFNYAVTDVPSAVGTDEKPLPTVMDLL